MKHIFFPLACLLLLAVPLNAQIRGRVYDDANANGQLDPATERGLSTIQVQAYDRLGLLVATTTTDTAGLYRFPLLPGQALRIQFDKLPAGYYPTAGFGLTHFVRKTEETCDLGLYQPSTYVGDHPRVAISIQPIGTHQDQRGDSLGSQAIKILSVDSTGTTQSIGVSPSQVGSIWGLAFERQTNRLFSAALAKRHSGFGPLGAGGIYQTDLTTKTTRPLVSLDALGVPTGPARLLRDLTSAYEGRMLDSLLFGWVGKMGLGGLDLSSDGTTLYTVNLYDSNVYGIHLPPNQGQPGAADVTQYSLPKTNCRGGTFRPFALKVHQGSIYVGGVCDAALSGRSSDLRGYVYALNPVTKEGREVVELPLTYKRGVIEYGVGNWFAWTDDPQQVMLAEPAWWAIHPQPILSDLEFDADGSLLIGLMDRLGHQMATGKGSADGRWPQTLSIAAGDVLRTFPKRTSFRVEANGGSNELQSAGAGNQQGPAGGEFYFQDEFTLGGTRYHQENGMGGLAVLPGRGQLLVSSREPVAEYNSAGISLYDNQTGKQVRSLVAYHHNPGVEFVARKTNHVGDVELISALPATRVGHRVWQDCDEDGQQDADELGIANVEVELWQTGKKVASTRTDSSGQYWFDSQVVNGGFIPNATYELRVAYQQAAYGRLSLTPATSSVSLSINSDAREAESHAIIPFSVSEVGANLTTLDFGFKCVDKPSASAQLVCRGSTALDATMQLQLVHTRPDERFDVSMKATYQGAGEYATAQPLMPGAPLFSQALVDMDSPSFTVRLLKPSGCYQDLFLALADNPGCAKLLTQLANAGEQRLKISPNPTTGILRATYRPLSEVSSPVLSVHTLKGTLVHQETLHPSGGAGQTSIDLTRQPAGIYILSVDEAGQRLSRQVLRQ